MPSTPQIQVTAKALPKKDVLDPLYTPDSPFLICAVFKANKKLVPSCGPNWATNPVYPACANIDGSFIVYPGTEIQFGILNANGIKCDLQGAQ